MEQRSQFGSTSRKFSRSVAIGSAYEVGKCQKKMIDVVFVNTMVSNAKINQMICVETNKSGKDRLEVGVSKS